MTCIDLKNSSGSALVANLVAIAISVVLVVVILQTTKTSQRALRNLQYLNDVADLSDYVVNSLSCEAMRNYSAANCNPGSWVNLYSKKAGTCSQRLFINGSSSGTNIGSEFRVRARCAVNSETLGKSFEIQFDGIGKYATHPSTGNATNWKTLFKSNFECAEGFTRVHSGGHHLVAVHRLGYIAQPPLGTNMAGIGMHLTPSEADAICSHYGGKVRTNMPAVGSYSSPGDNQFIWWNGTQYVNVAATSISNQLWEGYLDGDLYCVDPSTPVCPAN